MGDFVFPRVFHVPVPRAPRTTEKVDAAIGPNRFSQAGRGMKPESAVSVRDEPAYDVLHIHALLLLIIVIDTQWAGRVQAI
jgi:hypothetical protein